MGKNVFAVLKLTKHEKPSAVPDPLLISIHKIAALDTITRYKV
jgi:hypothetical protein